MSGNKVNLELTGDAKSLERELTKAETAADEAAERAKKLRQAFDGVGTSAISMKTSVNDSARSTRDVGDSFDRVGESADNLDTRAMGFRDTITGFQDLSHGLTGDFDSLGDQLVTLGMGFGDLASGVANFGTQFAKQAGTFIANTAKMVAANTVAVAKTVAGWVTMGLQATINAVKMAAAWLISLGPIGLVIAAVGAVIGILVAMGVGFDDLKRWAETAWNFILGLIQGAFNWVKENWPLVLAILTGPFGLAVLAITKNWDTIKSVIGGVLTWIGNKATAAKDWIVARFNDLVSAVTGLPGRIATAASGLFDGFKTAFKNAVNAIIGWWNGLSFTLPTIDIPGWDPPGPGPTFGGFSIGGQTFGTPDIPYLHTGGVYKAPPGRREGLAMLLDGERVLPPGQSGGGVIVNLNVQGSILSERDVVRIVRDEYNRGGFS